MKNEQDHVNAAGITNGQSRIPTRQETIRVYIFFSKKNSQKYSRAKKFFYFLGNLRYYEKIRYW